MKYYVKLIKGEFCEKISELEKITGEFCYYHSKYKEILSIECDSLYEAQYELSTHLNKFEIDNESIYKGDFKGKGKCWYAVDENDKFIQASNLISTRYCISSKETGEVLYSSNVNFTDYNKLLEDILEKIENYPNSYVNTYNLKDSLLTTISQKYFDEILKLHEKNQYNKQLEFISVDLSHIDLSNRTLINIHFKDSYLYKSNFSNTYFKDCTIENSDFTDTILEKTILINVNAKNTNLSEAQFVSADLKNCTFEDCQIHNVHFNKKNKEATKLLNCKFKSFINKMEKVSFCYTTIDNCSFEIDFTECDFFQATFKNNTTFENSNFKICDFFECTANKGDLQFNRSIFINCNFFKSKLINVEYNITSFDSCEFKKVNINQSKFNDIRIEELKFSKVEGFNLQLNKATIVSFNIYDSNLSNSKFNDCSTGYINIEHTTFIGVDINPINCICSYFKDVCFYSAQFDAVQAFYENSFIDCLILNSQKEKLNSLIKQKEENPWG